jgi:hypothetical protein
MNLYPYPNRKGRYLYLEKNKYIAQRKHSSGAREQSTFYTFDEAVIWLLNKWPED